MLRFILRKLKNYFKRLGKTLRRHPVKNTLTLILSLLMIYAIGHVLYSLFGIIPLIGYIFACFYDITGIIDKPKRTFVWAIGYAIGAFTLGLFFRYLYPTITGETAASMFSLAVTTIIILILFLQSRRFKKY